MTTPDPESLSLFAEAVIAVAGVLLSWLGITTARNRGEAARHALTDPYQTKSQVENVVMASQIKVTDSITQGFKDVENNLGKKIDKYHGAMTKRLDNHIGAGHGKD